MIPNKENYTGTSSSEDLSKCPVCGGSGWASDKRYIPEMYGETSTEYAIPCPACKGGHDKKVANVKGRANVPKAFYDADMSKFDWDLYIDDKGGRVDLSLQRKFVNSFIQDYPMWEAHGLGLYIWSHMKGSGKTFLASCICNELMKNNAMTTRFVSASDLINLAQSADKSSADKYERDPIGLLCDCKLLVIDDIGQKNTGDKWLQDILFRILDKRMNNRAVTIITSNIRLAQLEFDDRIVDRINRIVQPIPLPDYCVRVKQADEEKKRFLRERGLIS